MSEPTLAEQKFKEFCDIWLLTNPRPTTASMGKDMLALWSLRIVTIGAMGLSGTRTGSIVAETEQLARFVGLLGVPESFHWFFNGIEAVLVFMTVEVCLFASGYFIGHDQVLDKNKKWYIYLTITAILPALVSNVAPAFRLIGDEYFRVWLIFVTVIVGLATLAMALIAGRVMAHFESDFKVKYSKALVAWQARQASAWTRSAQYKTLRLLTTEKVDEIPTREKLLSRLNGSPTHIRDLAKTVKLSQKEVMSELRGLEEQKLVSIKGLNIQLVTPVDNA